MPTCFGKAQIKQERAVHLMFNGYGLAYINSLMRILKILNVYKIRLLGDLIFMHQVKKFVVPDIFKEKFRYPSYKYPPKKF